MFSDYLELMTIDESRLFMDLIYKGTSVIFCVKNNSVRSSDDGLKDRREFFSFLNILKLVSLAWCGNT